MLDLELTSSAKLLCGGETMTTKMNLDVEYRNLPHDGGKVSTIGIGVGSLHEATPPF